MRAFLRVAAYFSLGAVALLLLLEGALRFLPVNMGLKSTSNVNAWPLHNYEANRPYRYSYTWAMLNAHAGMTNNYGHIAPQDFQAMARPMIVVGDSFVESLMNDYGDTLQGILGARLGAAHPVYGLGVSGLSASDYIALSYQARVEFEPTAAVFLISDGDISESLLPREGGYFVRQTGSMMDLRYMPLSPSPVMAWVRSHIGEMALYQYLRSNLKFSPHDILGAFNWRRRGGLEPQRAPQPAIDRQLMVADWFLSELPRATGVAPQCIVLLIDADRYALYDPHLASASKDFPEVRRHLIDSGRKFGFKVVDMGPLFRAEYERTHLKFDYWPIDRHWSRIGHSLGAEAVMSSLFKSGEDLACKPGINGAQVARPAGTRRGEQGGKL
jgi:hypothetical protein